MNRQHGPDEPRKVSEELLNAFVDNQLGEEEKSRLFVEINQDERLNREACELRKVHELVVMAYQNVPQPAARPAGKRARHAGMGIAASIGLAIGVAFGWWLHDAPVTGKTLAPVAKQEAAAESVQVAAQKTPAAQAHMVAATARHDLPAASADNKALERVARTAPAPSSTSTILTAADTGTSSPEMVAFAGTSNISVATPERSTVVPAAAERGPANTESENATSLSRGPGPGPIADETTKVLIHVSDNSPRHLAQALEDIETLMRHYRSSGEKARVEVVINGNGLDLVRADVSVFPERIARLQKEYGNLSFAACQNTIDRLRRERGIVTRLLPGVNVIDSGVAQIMRRQHQGWAYIQV